jgi:hypothetical protein
MSRSATLKEDGPVLRAKEVDYSGKNLKELAYGEYKFVQANLVQGQLPTQTIPASATRYMDVELPSEPFNPARMEALYDLQIDAQGGGTYIWVPTDTLGELQSVTLTEAGKGQPHAQVEDANVYLKMSRKLHTTMQDFLDLTEQDALYRSDVMAVNNITAAPVGYVAAGGAGGNPPTGTVNYTEPQYMKVSQVANQAWPAQNTWQRRRFPLSIFRGTVLAQDATIYFPKTMVLRFTFAGQRAGWAGTSNVNPATGSAALAGNVNIKNFRVMIARETNEDIIKAAKAAVLTAGGRKIPIGWLARQKISMGSNTVHDPAIRLTSSDGSHLRQVLIAPFAYSEATNYMYDHSNHVLPSGAKTQGKLLEYDILYDAKKQYNDPFVCVPVNTAGDQYGDHLSDDYRINRQYFLGSVIQKREMYSQNWVHIESFMGPRGPDEGEVPENVLAGKQLASIPFELRLKSSTVCSDSATNPLNLQWYFYYHTTQWMTITKDGAVTDPVP